MAWHLTSHYLNHCWLIVSAVIRITKQWNLEYKLLKQNAFEDVVWNVTSILFRSPCLSHAVISHKLSLYLLHGEPNIVPSNNLMAIGYQIKIWDSDDKYTWRHIRLCDSDIHADQVESCWLVERVVRLTCYTISSPHWRWRGCGEGAGL